MLKIDLSDKVAFITGSSRGIGLCIAKFFAKCGAVVIINGRNEDILKEKSKEFNFDYLVGDISDHKIVKDIYRQIFVKYKRLDILVNNAGILSDAFIGMITDDIINNTIDINIKGVIYNTQCAAKLMGRNKSGSIINISSIIGIKGNAGQLVYSASKSSVIGMTLSASKELAKNNIRVNAIAPGYINTDMIKNIPDNIHKERIDSIKIGRVGESEDIANAVCFLASDLSSYITGQILGVDGGMLI
jgi:3-oxoacyl-[acyl-carrier protein] reductase